MNTTKPETSVTRELGVKYNFSQKLSFRALYKSSVSDVLNRGTSTYGYNETIDIDQEGLENICCEKQTQKLTLSNTLSKSREGNGRPQL